MQKTGAIQKDSFWKIYIEIAFIFAGIKKKP